MSGLLDHSISCFVVGYRLYKEFVRTLTSILSSALSSNIESVDNGLRRALAPAIELRSLEFEEEGKALVNGGWVGAKRLLKGWPWSVNLKRSAPADE